MADDRLKPWLELARDAYSASTSYFDANIRSQVERDLKAFQSQHAPGSKYLSDAYKARSRIYRPKTRTAIRKNESIAAEAFFSTKDVVSVTAGNQNDPLQQASAQVMQALLQYRLTKSIPWFLTCVGAYQDAMTVGMVASYQYWEYNARRGIDRPAIKLIPIENLRFDQGADWTDVVDSSPYLIRMVPMYVRDVQQRMSDVDPKTNQPRWLKLDEGAISKAVRGYGDSIRMTREGNRQDSREPGGAPVTAFSVVWVHQNFIRVRDDDWVYYTLGTEEVLSVPKPIESVYWHGQRPVVVGSAVLETHKTYPASIPQLGNQLQAEVNEIANQRIDNVKFVLNKRYFVARNRQVDVRSLTRNVPGSATFMQDVEKDVRVVDTPDVSRSAYEEQDRLNVDYDDVVGGFSQSSVQSNKNLNETVGGLNILNANASQVGAYQLRTFVETWAEPVLQQLALLEQEYETDEVILTLAGQDAELQQLGFDEVTDDMLTQQVTINVNVGIGATSPTQKVAQFLFAMKSLREILLDNVLQSHGMSVEEVVKELFGNLGYRDGGRFFDWENEDPQVAALQKQIEELQQALDAKMPPELLAATVKKIEAEIKGIEAKKVGAGVDAAYSAMQAAEVIAAIPDIGPVADEILKGAGYTNPVPPGVDPNFPVLPEVSPEIQRGVLNAAGSGLSVPVPPGAIGQGAIPHSPNPMNPSPPPGPESPGTGRMQGIQTQRPDGVPVQKLGSGGLVSSLMDDTIAGGGIDRNYGLGPVDSMMDQRVSDEEEKRRRDKQWSRALGRRDLQDLGFAEGGLIEAGNIDLTNRPRVTNPDGSVSTVRSKSFSFDGVETLLPTISDDGRTLSDEEAVAQYRTTGKHLGKFASPAEANAYAQQLHEQQAKGLARGGIIRGPGTGTSDSIPARVSENGRPIAVSDGEYVIPADVVRKLGAGYFDRLIKKTKGK